MLHNHKQCHDITVDISDSTPAKIRIRTNLELYRIEQLRLRYLRSQTLSTQTTPPHKN